VRVYRGALATAAKMKSDSHPVLNAAHELGISGKRGGSEVTGTSLTVYGEQATQRQLEATTVAPGPDSIRKSSRLRAALETESTEGVRHEPLAQPRVHGAENQIRVRRPHQVGACLATESLKGGRRDTKAAASSEAQIRRAQTQREAAQCSGYRGRIVESPKNLHAPGHLGKEADGHHHIRQDSKETSQASQVHGRLQ
jgi:hypothetical protein